MGKVVNITDGDGITISDTNSTHIANINPFRYRSYYYDTEIKLYYLHSRYYDPELCRFINADDINILLLNANSVSINLFTYCNCNPINFVDQNGLFATIVVKTIIGGLIGGLIYAVMEVLSQVVFRILDNLIDGKINDINIGKFFKEIRIGDVIVEFLSGFLMGALYINHVKLKWKKNMLISPRDIIYIITNFFDTIAKGFINKKVNSLRSFFSLLFDAFIGALVTFCISVLSAKIRAKTAKWDYNKNQSFKKIIIDLIKKAILKQTISIKIGLIKIRM